MSEESNIDEKDPRIIKCLKLVGDVYVHHGSGGGLHVVIDDGNVDGGCLISCQELIESKSYQDGSNWKTEPPTKARLRAERKCCKALLELSEDERHYVYAKHHGHEV